MLPAGGGRARAPSLCCFCSQLLLGSTPAAKQGKQACCKYGFLAHTQMRGAAAGSTHQALWPRCSHPATLRCCVCCKASDFAQTRFHSPHEPKQPYASCKASHTLRPGVVCPQAGDIKMCQQAGKARLRAARRQGPRSRRRRRVLIAIVQVHALLRGGRGRGRRWAPRIAART